MDTSQISPYPKYTTPRMVNWGRPHAYVLMDERKGVRVSLRKGFEVAGTLGILDLAARRGLINLAVSFDRLKTTNFRYRPEMLEDLLARFQAGR